MNAKHRTTRRWLTQLCAWDWWWNSNRNPHLLLKDQEQPQEEERTSSQRKESCPKERDGEGRDSRRRKKWPRASIANLHSCMRLVIEKKVDLSSWTELKSILQAKAWGLVKSLMHLLREQPKILLLCCPPFKSSMTWTPRAQTNSKNGWEINEMNMEPTGISVIFNHTPTAMTLAFSKWPDFLVKNTLAMDGAMSRSTPRTSGWERNGRHLNGRLICQRGSMPLFVIL